MLDTVIVFGNCQAQVISGMSNGLLTGKYQFVYVPSAASIGETALPEGAAERCVLLLEQLGIQQSFPFLDRLDPAARRVRFPPLNFLSPWPFTCADPRNRPAPPELPFGRFPYGDRIALQVWKEGLRGREAVLRYSEASLRAMPDLGRLLETELTRARMIEADAEVRVTDYIRDHFRSERLFYTHNHPTRKMVHLLFRRIWQAADLEPAEVMDVELRRHEEFFVSDANQWRPFEDYQQPIHAEVAGRLGLEWWRDDLTYFSTQVGRAVTHDEFFEWYLSDPGSRRSDEEDKIGANAD